MNDTPDFDARARDIVNGYGYLCADRMNDWNILQFASIVSAALLQAFEEGRQDEKEVTCRHIRAIVNDGAEKDAIIMADCIETAIRTDAHRMCQAAVTAGGTASSAPVEPLQTDVGGDAEILRRRFAQYLLRDYLRDPVKTAAVCDEYLDRTGRLLGYVRELARDLEAVPLVDKAATTSRPFEEPEQREGDEPDPQVETLA